MKRNVLIATIIVSAFIAGYSLNNLAISNTQPNYKIAVVDIQRIVANSDEIENLKTEQEKQMQNLQKTIEKARAEISQEKDPTKIAKLEDKYRQQINEQKIALDTSYNSKLTAIDNKIKTAVVEKARSMNYNIVLPKNTVLFGGDDITEQVANIIK
jgi:outer membrane protein